MQKTRSIENKTLILLSLIILTLILTVALTTPTLAKKDKEKKVEVVVLSVEKVDGKIWVTIGIYKNGELVKTITFDPPGWGPGVPDEDGPDE